MKAKLEAKEWFESLFAYGESQLSALFGTRAISVMIWKKKDLIFLPQI